MNTYRIPMLLVTLAGMLLLSPRAIAKEGPFRVDHDPWSYAERMRAVAETFDGKEGVFLHYPLHPPAHEGTHGADQEVQ